jgi:hypothetical protein
MDAPVAALQSPPTLLEHMGWAGTPADLVILIAHI